MKYYQEITIIDDGNNFFEIWQKLYTQLHIALADVKNHQGIDDIGVSFPEYRYEENNGKCFATLGTKLRIFANSKEDLLTLNMKTWLNRLADYVHIKSVNNVPENATPIVFIRYKQKGASRIEKDMQRLAIKIAQRDNRPLNECLAELEQTKPSANSKLPYIYMESEETKKLNPTKARKFPLFIQRIKPELSEEAKNAEAKFNTYGLGVNKNSSIVFEF